MSILIHSFHGAAAAHMRLLEEDAGLRVQRCRFCVWKPEGAAVELVDAFHKGAEAHICLPAEGYHCNQHRSGFVHGSSQQAVHMNWYQTLSVMRPDCAHR
jgi:hypothetical protein